nr:hypothetical protein [Tanacetum cinerariifolium]
LDDDCDAFDSDVDEAPTAQTMFMANLSYADPVTDKVGPSYDLDILSEALWASVQESPDHSLFYRPDTVDVGPPLPNIPGSMKPLECLWCDLKSFPQGVFDENKPLFIQLTPIASIFLVILDRDPLQSCRLGCFVIFADQ